MLLPPHNTTLAAFLQDADAHISRLKRTKRPTGIVRRGKVEFFLVTTGQFQSISAKADREALEESMRQFDEGLGIPWEEAKKELRRRAKAATRRRKHSA